MDYYQILGVSKESSQEDIKIAYKKLANNNHPDKGGNTDKLSQINQAYETLKDPQKRKKYDRDIGLVRDREFRGDFASSFYNNFGYYPDTRKNKNIQLTTNFNLKDTYLGKEVEIGYVLPSGRKEFVKTYVPRGFKDGDILHVGKFGDNSYPSIERGELYLILKIDRNPEWIVKGKNVITTKKVSVFDLITGTSFLLELPSGKKIDFIVPQGTQNDTTFCIKGYGIPETRRGDQGNLYIKIHGETPVINDSTIIDKIKKISKKI